MMLRFLVIQSWVEDIRTRKAIAKKLLIVRF